MTETAAPELTSGERKLIRLLQSHSNTRVYLASAARGRYAVVAETSRPGRYVREHAVAVGTVDTLRRAGLVEHQRHGDGRINLGDYSGRRHLDDRDGHQISLTDAGRAFGRRPASSTS